MPQPAITIEDLSKAYRIGAKEEVPDTLVGAAQGLLTAPWKNLQRLRRLNTSSQSTRSGNGGASDEDDILWALRGVSFDVAEGEVVGIIGRNGAGKSTLLKILSRITEPTEGRAVIRGRVSSLLEVGTGFHPELTGRENIYMNGTILGMTKREIDRKFDQIVDFSGVEKFLDTPVKRYSSGMSVRLAFAVAAHLEPEILIIDEVLAVGDAEFQKKCLGKMQDVAESGRTVLFVSHNLGAVEALCTECVCLSHGRVVGQGKPAATISDYISSLTVKTNGHAFGEDSFIQSLVIGDGETEPLVRMGEELKITVGYRSDRDLRDLQFGIAVEDAAGHRLLALSTTEQCPNLLPRPASAGEVICRVDSTPFTPGNYFITVYSHDRYGRFETVRGVASFEVVPADVYETGQIPSSEFGVVYCRAAWAFEQVGTNA